LFLIAIRAGNQIQPLPLRAARWRISGPTGTCYPAVRAASPRFTLREGSAMSIVRSIEVIAQSPNSFDDACREAIKEAAKTLRGINSFWIKNAECVVENDQITMYRVNGKISFLLEESR
jgi:flavin-binding protein dodecin